MLGAFKNMVGGVVYVGGLLYKENGRKLPGFCGICFFEESVHACIFIVLKKKVCSPRHGGLFGGQQK